MIYKSQIEKTFPWKNGDTPVWESVRPHNIYDVVIPVRPDLTKLSDTLDLNSRPIGGKLSIEEVIFKIESSDPVSVNITDVNKTDHEMEYFISDFGMRFYKLKTKELQLRGDGEPIILHYSKTVPILIHSWNPNELVSPWLMLEIKKEKKDFFKPLRLTGCILVKYKVEL
jgi:hypothetical protein